MRDSAANHLVPSIVSGRLFGQLGNNLGFYTLTRLHRNMHNIEVRTSCYVIRINVDGGMARRTNSYSHTVVDPAERIKQVSTLFGIGCMAKLTKPSKALVSGRFADILPHSARKRVGTIDLADYRIVSAVERAD